MKHESVRFPQKYKYISPYRSQHLTTTKAQEWNHHIIIWFSFTVKTGHFQYLFRIYATQHMSYFYLHLWKIWRPSWLSQQINTNEDHTQELRVHKYQSTARFNLNKHMTLMVTQRLMRHVIIYSEYIWNISESSDDNASHFYSTQYNPKNTSSDTSHAGIETITQPSRRRLSSQDINES